MTSATSDELDVSVHSFLTDDLRDKNQVSNQFANGPILRCVDNACVRHAQRVQAKKVGVMRHDHAAIQTSLLEEIHVIAAE